MPRATLGSIVLSKLLFMPLCTLALVAALGSLVPLPPMLVVVMILESATPTANNLMVMVHLSGGNRAGMSTAIFTQYCFAPILLTLSITAFTVMIKSFEGKILECDPDLQVCDYDER